MNVYYDPQSFCTRPRRYTGTSGILYPSLSNAITYLCEAWGRTRDTPVLPPVSNNGAWVALATQYHSHGLP